MKEGNMISNTYTSQTSAFKTYYHGFLGLKKASNDMADMQDFAFFVIFGNEDVTLGAFNQCAFTTGSVGAPYNKKLLIALMGYEYNFNKHMYFVIADPNDSEISTFKTLAYYSLNIG